MIIYNFNLSLVFFGILVGSYLLARFFGDLGIVPQDTDKL